MTTINSLAHLRETAPILDVVLCKGYEYAGDGGGGVFIWHPRDSQPDDGGVVIARNPADVVGRWIRQHTIGEIDVRWFGAKGDGTTDDSEAFRRARDYAKHRARRDPQVASDPLGSVKIKISAGTYKITVPETMLDRSWSSSTLGLSYEGLGPGISAIKYQPSSSGPLLYNNNALLFLRFSGLLFACNDAHSTFYESVSLSKAQDVRCDDVAWTGTWAFGFKLSGSNTNSEYKWTACSISGGWDYFLELDGNDQLLNYWFSQCKFWLWGGGGWVRAHRGGHIKISDCDVSAWTERGSRPLFALLGTNHARGVCHFLCIGCRFEIHADTAPIIQSQWPHGVISFMNADFGSQAPWRSRDYVEALIEIGPTGHAMVKWQDCTHIGRHIYRRIDGSRPDTLGELYKYIAARLRWMPSTQVEYTGCTHLSVEAPDEMVVIDRSVEESLLRPSISFHNCRSELIRDGLPSAQWNSELGPLSSGLAILSAKTASCPVFAMKLNMRIVRLPPRSIVTRVHFLKVRERSFSATDKFALVSDGGELCAFDARALKDGRFLTKDVGYVVDRPEATFLSLFSEFIEPDTSRSPIGFLLIDYLG